MYLHCNSETLKKDLKELIASCSKGLAGQRQHQELAVKLKDSNCSVRKNATISVWVNCAECLVNFGCTLITVWQNGKPIEFSLADGGCPECNGKKGFHYTSTSGLHA